MFHSEAFLEVFLAVGGFLWLHGMARRWRIDYEELRSASDGSAKLAIGILWLATLFIALGWCKVIWGVISRLIVWT